jgi:hypothetical protein
LPLVQGDDHFSFVGGLTDDDHDVFLTGLPEDV